MVRDMTKGSPIRCIASFAAPVYFGMLFQQMYNMADAFIIARVLGLEQLAGVGATSALYFLIIGACTGFCGGFAIPVARALGAKDERALRDYAAAGIVVSFALALVVTALTVCLCRPALRWMNTPEEAFEYAYAYILPIFAGIPFTFLYNLLSSYIRALGDSRTPVVFLVLCTVLNVALDFLFILVFDMGVSGAAIATVISQGVSGLICIGAIYKKFPLLRLKMRELRARHAIVREICLIGLPMGLQYGITAIGSIMAQTAVNAFGGSAVAGVTAAGKVHAFLSCPQEALGVTMATYAGQNMGAGRLDRVSRGLKTACAFGIALSLCALALVFMFGDQWIGLFIESGEALALSRASMFLRVSVAGFSLLTLVNAVRFTIQGMSYSTLAMVSGALEMLARCFVAFFFPGWFGFTGVCFANICAWVCADAFLIPAYFYVRRRVALTAGFRALGETRQGE